MAPRRPSSRPPSPFPRSVYPLLVALACTLSLCGSPSGLAQANLLDSLSDVLTTSTASTRTVPAPADEPAAGDATLATGAVPVTAVNPVTAVAAATANTTGPCSALIKIIQVRSGAGFAQRRLYPMTQTVHLIVRNNIVLKRALLLANWSCTVIRAYKFIPITISYAGQRAPVLSVVDSSNLLFIGIGLRTAVNVNSKSCGSLWFKEGKENRLVVCPALYISRSWAIQYTQANVYGRIDVFRSLYVKLDSLKVTMPKVYLSGERFESWSTRGIIRVGEVGTGPHLIKSYIVISNNEVYDSWELVTLYRGAVGVTVRNNHLHTYRFTAVRCGADISFTMDCHLNTISYNYIYSPIGKQLTGDSAGIYFCTHYFNPGNVLSCNYVVGGDHCYYLDLVSTAITVRGGVCHGNLDGLKINGGKFNSFRFMVMVDMQLGAATYTSCMFASGKDIINCAHESGHYWNEMRLKYYNTPRINKAFPFFENICPGPRGSVNGVQCNPNLPGAVPASVTDSCSGLPYGNTKDLVLVDTLKGDNTAKLCSPAHPTIDELNTFRPINTSTAAGGFRDPANGDFGLLRTSRIWRQRPNFVSCPRILVGPQRTRPSSYFADYNKRKPFWFKDVLALSMKMLIDHSIPRVPEPV